MWQLGIVQLSDSFLLLYLRRDRVWNLTWDQKWSPLSAAEEPEDPPWWWRGRSWERGREEEEVSRMKQLTRTRLIPVRLKSWESMDVSYRWRLLEVKGQFEDIWSRTSTPEALEPPAVMIHWDVWSLANVVQREVSPVRHSWCLAHKHFLKLWSCELFIQ